MFVKLGSLRINLNQILMVEVGGDGIAQVTFSGGQKVVIPPDETTILLAVLDAYDIDEEDDDDDEFAQERYYPKE
jgi:hypothetical protein